MMADRRGFDGMVLGTYAALGKRSAQASGIVTRMGGDALPVRNGWRGSGRSGQETGTPRARPLGDAKLRKISHVKKPIAGNVLAHLKQCF